MGFFINNEIATVNDLNQVTLAHNPHFIKFESLKETEGTPFYLKMILTPPDDLDATMSISLVESGTGIKHEFKSTTKESEVNKNTFYVARDGIAINIDPTINIGEPTAWGITTQNIYRCLIQDPFFKNNYDVSTGFITDHNNNISSNNEIHIKAKKPGAKYNLEVNISLQENKNGTLEEDAFIFSVQNGSIDKNKHDTIDYNSGKYNIELEVYTDIDVFLGEDDTINQSKQGKRLTSLVKSYHKDRMWFDINSLLSKRTGYSDSFIDSVGWCDAGTVQNYRLIGKRNNGINSEVFYSSEVLYVLNGYDYTLSLNNLNKHIFDVISYDGNKIKPLTNSPTLNHVKGQKHYFNFILKDAAHNINLEEYKIEKKDIGLLYKFYTQSGEYLGETVKHEQSQQAFSIVNTIEIGLDTLIAEMQNSLPKTIGKIDVMLSCNGFEVSEPVIYHILPDNTYTVKDFAFLNRLGGWDCFNFGNYEASEFKTNAETFYQTLTPDYKSHSRIEAVNRKYVSETFSVKSQPICKNIAEWLREMSASPAVYDLTTSRYIIISDMNLKYNAVDDLFLIEMKYRYSDSFNSGNSGDSK